MDPSIDEETEVQTGWYPAQNHAAREVTDRTQTQTCVTPEPELLLSPPALLPHSQTPRLGSMGTLPLTIPLGPQIPASPSFLYPLGFVQSCWFPTLSPKPSHPTDIHPSQFDLSCFSYLKCNSPIGLQDLSNSCLHLLSSPSIPS